MLSRRGFLTGLASAAGIAVIAAPTLSRPYVADAACCLSQDIALLPASGLTGMPAQSLAADGLFRLPFDQPPGPATWLLGQGYGNTTGAFNQRRTTYSQGQGLHFGLDLSCPCGTSIVAIGDGVVSAVDGPFGSPPHNVMIDHGNGYSSLYGHLVERSAQVRPGQRVAAGQPIGRSGDSQSTCYSAPHLHLEVRNNGKNRAYNPIPLIAADWDSLALAGGFGRGFERDLGDPRRWQHPQDQPETIFGGRLLNDYAQPFPPDRPSR